MKPVIFGIAGPALDAGERAFFRKVQPAGFILFARNVETNSQLLALTDHLRTLCDREDLPILIDQEGGRVARLGPPHWPVFPGAAAFGALYECAPISAIEAARVNALAIAAMLRAAGITVACQPLLDVGQADTTAALADRVYGHEPMRVAAIGRAMLEGLRAGGVVGIVKHIPGHGRAAIDPHHHLPFVDAEAAALESDLAPFRSLADAPMAMTAHVVFKAWDADRPATLSPIVIRDIIREQIGFSGLLITDDIAMGALAGDIGDSATAAIDAGCDIVLHCSAAPAEMAAIASRLTEASDATRDRLKRAMAPIAAPLPVLDQKALIATRDALMRAGGIGAGA